MQRFTLSLILLAFLGGPPADAADPAARLVGGESFAGRVTGVDRAWQVSLSVSGSARTVPGADLVRWGAPAEPPLRTWILLDDGGLLAADLVSMNAERVEVDSDALGTLTLPGSQVAGVVLRPPAAAADQDALVDRLAQRQTTDRLLLANGDELRGTLEQLADGKARMRTDVGPVDVELRKLRGVALAKLGAGAASPAGLRAWIGLRDGSRLLARGLETVDGKLRVELAGATTAQTTLDALVWLQPIGGRAEYLSDRPAADYRHVPYLSLKWPYRLDRNVTGSRLCCQGQRYLKGIGLHSAARITYLLDAPYERFEAEAAIDDVAAGGGSVRFRVFVDGQPRYASEVIRGGQAPTHISVEIAGAKRLDLIVDYADRADQLDHADWLDARVVKAQGSNSKAQ